MGARLQITLRSKQPSAIHPTQSRPVDAMAELLWSNIAHQVESPCPNNGQQDRGQRSVWS